MNRADFIADLVWNDNAYGIEDCYTCRIDGYVLTLNLSGGNVIKMEIANTNIFADRTMLHEEFPYPEFNGGRIGIAALNVHHYQRILMGKFKRVMNEQV